MKNLFVICIIIFIAVVFVYGQDDLGYRKIYDKFSKLSDRELNDLGLFYFDEHCFDSSLICFSIISSRYKPKNSVVEKRIYVNALNKMGVIYWNHYNYS